MSPTLSAVLDRIVAGPDPLDRLRPNDGLQAPLGLRRAGAVADLTHAVESIGDATAGLGEVVEILRTLAEEEGVASDLDTLADRVDRLARDIDADTVAVLTVRDDLQEVLFP